VREAVIEREHAVQIIGPQGVLISSDALAKKDRARPRSGSLLPLLSKQRDCREFRVGLGMIGAREPVSLARRPAGHLLPPYAARYSVSSCCWARSPTPACRGSLSVYRASVGLLQPCNIF
jgi:hypothetical protein